MRKFLGRYGKLLGWAGISILCLAGVFSGPIEENILTLVPKSIKRQVLLFEQSALSQKLLVFVTSKDAEQTRQIAQQVQAQLMQAQLIQPPMAVSAHLVQDMLAALPARFSAAVQQQTERKLAPAAVAAQLAAYYEQLFSFQSFFVTQLIAQDPFYLTEILFNQWAALGRGISGSYEQGSLVSQDGKIRAGMYEARGAVSDLKAAEQLQRFFTKYQSSLPAGVRVFFMGGLRYTLENASLIKRDLGLITLVGVAGLAILFSCFFRTKRALLIYALPFWVLPPAALVTQLCFGRISGITLGFGSVVVGLSVDYAIYVYFALQHPQARAAGALAQIRKHLVCNFLTSVLCFAALFFSSIEVFKQIAVFAGVALSLALWISLRVLPSYFAGEKMAQTETSCWKLTPFSFRAACWMSLLLLVLGGWAMAHVSFSQSLDSLNSTAANFTQDKHIMDELFSAERHALLFTLGRTQEEALANNEKLAVRLGELLPVSTLFVSAATRSQNEARWKEFWKDSRRNQVRQLLQNEAQQKGFKLDTFAPFWKWLEQANSTAATDFSAWYNPVLSLSSSLYAVVNVVPDEPRYARAADGKTTIFVSASQLQKDLVQGVKREALRVVFLALLFNLIAVGAIFKNWKDTLLCFLPVVLGGCILFGCLWLFNVRVNLFGLIFLPLLIGLGIDYAIFQLMKYRSQNTAGLYPPRALAAAGLSTLAGFGVLVLAKHAVLFMMGLCALLGIGGAMGAALWILPSFKEKIK